MIIHNDFTQDSIEWHEIRRGRFGGTDAHLFFVTGRNENEIGSGLQSAIYDKVAKRVFDDEEAEYLSDAMLRGIELEPMALAEYENICFTTVERVGYVERGYWFGVSPDGLISQNGLIEIKCPLGKEFLRYKTEQTIDLKYVAQMQWAMWVTERKWCDFVAYHPDGGILVRRIERDPEAIELLNRKAPIVEQMLNELYDSIR